MVLIPGSLVARQSYKILLGPRIIRTELGYAGQWWLWTKVQPIDIS